MNQKTIGFAILLLFLITRCTPAAPTATPTITPLPSETPTLTPDAGATTTQAALLAAQTADAVTATAEYAMTGAAETVVAEAETAIAQAEATEHAGQEATGTAQAAATQTEAARPTATATATETPPPPNTPEPPTPSQTPTETSDGISETGGVALGLDFVVPEGWTLENPDDFSAGIIPGAEDESNRSIRLARGAAEEFDDLNFPAEEADAAGALQAVAEALLDRGDYGQRVRVEPVQIDEFSGAIVSLRGEETATRLYLFRLGSDDWLMIFASANLDAFNTFNRNELRDFLASLENVSGGEALTVEPIGPIEEVVVTHVSDGDTISVLLNGVEESVRIIGIDTPEAHHPDSGADWLGYAATHVMERFVQAGDTVYLESDIKDRDDYDRLLRYLWIKDADDNWLMVEAELIRAGMAHVRTYDEVRYVPYFMALEAEARETALGVWGDPPPPPPTEPIAQRNDRVWAINPDSGAIPMLYDAAALGNVPDPVAIWPNNVSAIVRDVYYVYPEDIDPVTGQAVSEDKVGYWYWLEINDFRGWVPERWLLLDEPEWTYPAPGTDIIAYAEPFVVSEEPLPVVSEAGGDEVLGTLEPESRAQAQRLGIDPETGDWWLYVETQAVNGWVPLANLNRLSPENR